MHTKVLVAVSVIALWGSAAGTRLVLYETDFEHGGDFPPGWVVESYGVGDDWYMAGSPSDYFPEVRGAPTGPQDEWLISPEVDCSSYGTVMLEYTFYFRDWPYTPPDTGFVHVSTDGGATWPPENLVVLYAGASDGGTPSFDISAIAGYQSQVRIRWRYVGDFGYNWWIDDLSVTAGAEKDVGVVQFEGPSPGSSLRAGMSTHLFARVSNYGTAPQADIPVECTVEPGGYVGQATVDALGAGEDTLISFEPQWQSGQAGVSYTLTAWTSLEGDEDPSNDACAVGPLETVDFAPTNGTVLLYDGDADSVGYAQVMQSAGTACDFWHTAQGGLYDLEPWTVVLLAQASGYPSSATQFSVMRYADGATPESPRGLLVSGDHLGHFYDIGSLMPRFYRHYLRSTYGGEFSVIGDSLVYGVHGDPLSGEIPSDTLGIAMESPDKIIPAPEEPPSLRVYVYTTSVDPAAAAIRHSGGGCNTLYLAFEFGQIHQGEARDFFWQRAFAWLTGELEAPGPPEPGSSMLRLRVFPQPMREEATFSVSGGAATCRVYDLRGLMVRQLLPEGAAVRWDGANDLGRPVAPGTYVVLAEAGRSRASERLVLVR